MPLLQKPRQVLCMDRVYGLGLRLTWIYPRKRYEFTSSGYSIRIQNHRVPWFLTLHLHILLERVIMEGRSRFLGQFPFTPLFLPYDILFGVICGYNMREILWFWRGRYHDCWR